MKKIIIIGILVLTMAMAVPAMAFEKGTIRLGAGTGLLGTGSGFSTTTLDRDAAGDFDIAIGSRKTVVGWILRVSGSDGIEGERIRRVQGVGHGSNEWRCSHL